MLQQFHIYKFIIRTVLPNKTLLFGPTMYMVAI